MELNDILEKLSLPQDLTRRGFLKAASAAAALGLLNDARAKNGVRPYVILETAKGLIIADPNLCVACHGLLFPGKQSGHRPGSALRHRRHLFGPHRTHDALADFVASVADCERARGRRNRAQDEVCRLGLHHH